MERAGRILSAGFGDRVMTGIIIGFLKGVTPERANQYIEDGLKLGYWLPEGRWQKYKRLAKKAKIRTITAEDIIKELKKHHLDLLSIILNHPQGREWLDHQIANMKEKLDLK